MCFSHANSVHILRRVFPQICCTTPKYIIIRLPILVRRWLTVNQNSLCRTKSLLPQPIILFSSVAVAVPPFDSSVCRIFRVELLRCCSLLFSLHRFCGSLFIVLVSKDFCSTRIAKLLVRLCLFVCRSPISQSGRRQHRRDKCKIILNLIHACASRTFFTVLYMSFEFPWLPNMAHRTFIVTYV